MRDSGVSLAEGNFQKDFVWGCVSLCNQSSVLGGHYDHNIILKTFSLTEVNAYFLFNLRCIISAGRVPFPHYPENKHVQTYIWP